jgi:cell division protein FtsB
MANGLVIHISAGEDRHTEALSQDSVLVGTGEDCDVRLLSSYFPDNYIPNGHILELMRGNTSFRVKNFDKNLTITHNDKPLETGARILDGDALVFANSDLILQFFLVRSLPMVVGRETQVAPFIENAAIEAAITPKRDDAKVFLREFTRELIREINPTTKIITLLISLFFVFGVLYLGFSLYSEIKRTRQINDDQKNVISQQQQELKNLTAKIKEINDNNQKLIEQFSFAPRVVEKYSNGVCLIYSVYYFVEAGTGRPLRYQDTQYNENGEVIQNGEDLVPLTTNGGGAVAEYESVGTGFYVGNGYVLTNKHVALPWLGDERVMRMASLVKGVPRLRKIYAYFPGRAEAINLKNRLSSQSDDVAVCVFEDLNAAQGIPSLPLSENENSVVRGNKVVLMGYPNGPDRLLAVRNDAEARDIQARCGSSIETLLKCLASKNRIQTLNTDGTITDLDPQRIVHNAQTSEGGSGAPLFGQSEEVIGISFAVFTENTASNLALPIRLGISLLQRAGWKKPTPESQQTNQESKSNPTALNNNPSETNN